MAVLALQTLLENGVLFTANLVACAGGGDSAPNDGKTFLAVKNGDSGSHTVTVTPAKATTQQDGLGSLSKAAIAVAIGAGDYAVIGPFAPALFNDVNGRIAITYDAVTSMKIMPVRLAKV